MARSKRSDSVSTAVAYGLATCASLVAKAKAIPTGQIAIIVATIGVLIAASPPYLTLSYVDTSGEQLVMWYASNNTCTNCSYVCDFDALSGFIGSNSSTPAQDTTPCDPFPPDIFAGACVLDLSSCAPVGGCSPGCPPPVVGLQGTPVSAYTAYDRVYAWSIGKTVSPIAAVSLPEQPIDATYTVEVSKYVAEDRAFVVSGVVSLYNYGPSVAVVTGVGIDVSPSSVVTATRTFDLPAHTVDAGAQILLSFEVEFPSLPAVPLVVSVAVDSEMPEGTPADRLTIEFPVAFDPETTVVTPINDVASVSDTYPEGPNVVQQQSSATWTYAIAYQLSSKCQSLNVTNVASVAYGGSGGDSQPTIVSSGTVLRLASPCPGCTHGIGYWKTHAGVGHQADVVSRHLPIWLGTPSASKSVEITTRLYAVSVLSYLSQASNGLAKMMGHLLAAKLNVAAGAEATVIQPVIDQADGLLASLSYTQWASTTASQRSTIAAVSDALERYNEGYTGPGHCDD